MRVAVVHDWLTQAGGAEKVLEKIFEVYPKSDLFTIVDFSDKANLSFLKSKTITTSFIQKLPFAKNKYRYYLPLMPIAVEQFDLSGYDLIISSSYCVAKGVLTGPDQIHVCYCHSPVRYAWDLQHQYLKETGFDKGLFSPLIRLMLHRLRIWDIRSAYGVDAFIANSNFIKKRIKKVYNRAAVTIYPPVNIEDFELREQKDDFYLTCSRLVPYKRIDLIVRAFKELPEKRLLVIGDGPEMAKIQGLAGKNVELMGHQPFAVLKQKMMAAKAFIFAAEEDFGIVPVEAQACGTPIIAYGKGGSLETVVGGKTGVFFKEQNVKSLIDAIKRLDNMKFEAKEIRCHAETFSEERFRTELKVFINNQLGRAPIA